MGVGETLRAGAGVGAAELSTTARNRPSMMTCWDHNTGAAAIRLLVNTAAASWSGPSLMTTATSGCQKP